MSRATSSRGGMLKVTWQVRAGSEHIAIDRDAWESRLLADGTWYQETLAPARPPFLPEAFRRGLPLWRRLFLIGSAVEELQLSWISRTVRLWSPPTLLKAIPEWTLVVRISTAMGPLVFIRSMQTKAFPARSLAKELLT